MNAVVEEGISGVSSLLSYSLSSNLLESINEGSESPISFLTLIYDSLG